MNRLSQTSKRVDFGIGMSQELLRQIDSTRGDVPRSVWIRKAAIAQLNQLQAKGMVDKEV